MDIDIDISPDVDIDKIFDEAIPASMEQDGELKKHPVGFYFQTIPRDKMTGLAAIPYDKAEEHEFFKIDMLHVHLLKHFKSKQEMRDFLKKEPDWSLLEERNIVKKLFHLGNHFDVVYEVKPKSVQEIADVIALIRPGKRRLLNKYIKAPDKIRPELFTKRENSDMRKAHAIPYALLVVLQLHLIEIGRI